MNNDEKVTTINGKCSCLECKNEIEVDADMKEGDVLECPYCGIEYELAGRDDNDESQLQLIEEEK